MNSTEHIDNFSRRQYDSFCNIHYVYCFSNKYDCLKRTIKETNRFSFDVS